MTIIHSNGDTTEWSSTTITYFLGQGDQAKLTYTFDGMCMSGGLPRFVVRKDGEVIHDVNAGSGIEFDVSTSGFYETDGPYIDYYSGPGTFFIVNGQVPLVELDVKAWLQGPYDPDSGSMHDNLRIAGILPSYLNIDSTTLAITGPNAVVDQVLVELRLDNAHYTPCGRVSGLLQRDGDVVASDGFSPLTIDAPAGSYYVIIGHRNHLRAMTASGHWLSGVPVTLDFRDPEFPVFGTEAQKIQGDAALLWAGKVVSGFFSI